MNRVLLTTSMMTPCERAAGRFMRAPDHAEAGGAAAESGATGDNTGVNSGDSSNTTPTGDNGGQPDELAGFWEDKPDEKPDADSDDGVEASKQLGQSLAGLIENYQTPEIFTKETADQIADGDLSGINKAFHAATQATMKQQVAITAKLLGGVMDRMQADFDRRIQSALGNKDSEIALETHFPSAKDPQVRPIVQRVWDQALKNTKGDKERAITLTRNMLEAFGTKTGLREPPQDPTLGMNTSASKRLVDDLLNRG